MSPPSSRRRAERPRRRSRRRGRLIFALDATMSRQPTWDLAQSLQAQMFQAAARLGGLDVQLVYFRGFSECRASRLRLRRAGARRADGPHRGARRRRRRSARCSPTRATKRGAPRSARWCSSATRWRRTRTALPALAGELALAGRQGVHVPGGRRSRRARARFSEIARLTGGAYSAFDAGAAARLEALLARGRRLCRRRPAALAAQAVADGGAAAAGADARP